MKEKVVLDGAEAIVREVRGEDDGGCRYDVADLYILTTRVDYQRSDKSAVFAEEEQLRWRCKEIRLWWRRG